jgi:outer membrane protein, heavy metal efflux system
MRPRKNNRCAPRFQRTILAGFFLVAAFHSHAQQDSSVLRLDEVLTRMDTSYPALLQYNQKLRAVEASAQGARSWMPPTVSVGLDRFGYQPRMWSEESPMNQAGVMIAAEQMFPNPSKLDSRSNAVSAQSAPLRYDSAWLKNSLRADARFYYYRRVTAERKLFILQESIVILDMLIATAEARYAVNQADLSTIFKAKARRAELANMETMLRAQIAESNIGINTLMNRDLSTPFRVDTAIRLRNIANSPAFDSLQKRSDLLAVDASIYAMRQEQAAMRAGLGPDFGVRVAHMQMLGMPNQFSVMGMMVIPIAPWSSGMYRSEIRAMDYRIGDMELEKQNMQLMARRMAAEKLVMLRSETQQLRNYDSLIVPAYRDNYDAALLAYRNNTGSFFVLLDAWDMLLMKKLEAADQLYKVLLLQTQYEYEIEQ